MKLIEFIEGISQDNSSKIALTISSILLLFLIRLTLTRYARKIASVEMRRRWIVLIRNMTISFLLVLFLLIWSEQIQNLALSLAAIIVALVVATKELIMCVVGGMMKMLTRPFKLGDRIELSGIYGDVIDGNFLTTTLLELGNKGHVNQYTGRSVVLPNSLFLANPVINETFMHKYILHNFTIPCPFDEKWSERKKILFECSSFVCQGFIKDAEFHFNGMVEKEGLNMPSVSPRVSINFESSSEIVLVVRVPCTVKLKGKIEQKIKEKYLEKIFMMN